VQVAGVAVRQFLGQLGRPQADVELVELRSLLMQDQQGAAQGIAVGSGQAGVEHRVDPLG